MDPDVRRIISFWFNRNPIEWIIAPEGLDEQLKSEFGDLVQKARQNELDDWSAEPESSLALTVLLDQFPRNIFRGTPEALASDPKAWDIATKSIARDFDKQVTVMQASAFYMTLLQQETRISVIAARGLFEALKSRCVSPEEHDWVDKAILASNRHPRQLEMFGRYPTRNKTFGRASTEAEKEYLGEGKPSLK
ncbi:hypothetical protein F5Y10DRAFT_238553 [Nemania abortiva]|nr:hypothetical protein F5Y10DRAFT_238553 [Nemania abortiva]